MDDKNKQTKNYSDLIIATECTSFVALSYGRFVCLLLPGVLHKASSILHLTGLRSAC